MTFPARRSWLGGGLALLILSAGFADPPPSPPTGPTAVLPPFRIHDEAICSFGFSFSCYGDAKTKQISWLVITDIQQGSRADTIGLTRGDTIVAVDGIKVADLKGGLARDGDLMRLFVNRKYGDTITLTVGIHGTYYRLTLPARPASRPREP